ncbi:hypothetical protein HN935_02860 [archaeon]|nr:hypothetical protein [archaeon]
MTATSARVDITPKAVYWTRSLPRTITWRKHATASAAIMRPSVTIAANCTDPQGPDIQSTKKKRNTAIPASTAVVLKLFMAFSFHEVANFSDCSTWVPQR